MRSIVRGTLNRSGKWGRNTKEHEEYAHRSSFPHRPVFPCVPRVPRVPRVPCVPRVPSVLDRKSLRWTTMIFVSARSLLSLSLLWLFAFSTEARAQQPTLKDPLLDEMTGKWVLS